MRDTQLERLRKYITHITRHAGAPWLLGGDFNVDAIADQLAMHPRSLQRRLVTEDVRCQDLIERERRVLATRYLAEPGLQLGQIAGLLGYAEQSTLNRSCRRWFGKTPRQYRAELQKDPDLLTDDRLFTHRK